MELSFILIYCLFKFVIFSLCYNKYLNLNYTSYRHSFPSLGKAFIEENFQASIMEVSITSEMSFFLVHKILPRKLKFKRLQRCTVYLYIYIYYIYYTQYTYTFSKIFLDGWHVSDNRIYCCIFCRWYNPNYDKLTWKSYKKRRTLSCESMLAIAGNENLTKTVYLTR